MMYLCRQSERNGRRSLQLDDRVRPIRQGFLGEVRLDGTQLCIVRQQRWDERIGIHSTIGTEGIRSSQPGDDGAIRRGG